MSYMFYCILLVISFKHFSYSERMSEGRTLLKSFLWSKMRTYHKAYVCELYTCQNVYISQNVCIRFLVQTLSYIHMHMWIFSVFDCRVGAAHTHVHMYPIFATHFVGIWFLVQTLSYIRIRIWIFSLVDCRVGAAHTHLYRYLICATHYVIQPPSFWHAIWLIHRNICIYE